MAHLLQGPAGPLLLEGCRRLGLKTAAAAELMRFLRLKRWYDSQHPDSTRVMGMSPGAAVDRLWHFMLLNTRMSDKQHAPCNRVQQWLPAAVACPNTVISRSCCCVQVSGAVQAALGGVVEHVGTDEDDLSDERKMLQRLLSLNMMALEGWAPDLELWRDPGTIMQHITYASDAAPGSPDAPPLRFTCPAMTAAQLQQLQQALQAAYGRGQPQPNGFAAQESQQLVSGLLSTLEHAPLAQPQPLQMLQQQVPPPEPLQLVVLLTSNQPTRGAVLSSVSLTVDGATCTVGSLKQTLRSVDDNLWREHAANARLFCAGLGTLDNDSATLGQLGITGYFVLRWCCQPPRFAALSVTLKAPVAFGVPADALAGRLAPWMRAIEAAQAVQLVTRIPITDLHLQLNGRLIPSGVMVEGENDQELRSLLRPDNPGLEIHVWEVMRPYVPTHMKMHIALPTQLGGQCISLSVPLANTTVADVLELLCEHASPEQQLRLRQHHSLGQLRLIAAHIPGELPLSAAIASQETDCGDVLRLLLPGAQRPQLPATVPLQVKTLTGKITHVKASLDMFVGELKRLIQAETGIPANQQRLIFDGRQLEDSTLLADYGVPRRGCTLHLVLRMTGC